MLEVTQKAVEELKNYLKKDDQFVRIYISGMG